MGLHRIKLMCYVRQHWVLLLDRYVTCLADVDVSPNLNTFNFWTAEYEYIKKTGIRIHFFKIEGIHESNYLFGQNPYESIYGLESEYASFFAIEYEYNYPLRDMDLSPTCHMEILNLCGPWGYAVYKGDNPHSFA